MGYVYVIGIEGSDLLKIGKCIVAPIVRLRALQIGTPEIEAQIHRLLSKKRRTGEWFDVSVDEIDTAFSEALNNFNIYGNVESGLYRCIHCKSEFPQEKFVLLESGNRSRVCQECRRKQHCESTRKWAEKNHGRRLHGYKLYRENNREKRSDYQKKYRAEHINYYQDYGKKYYQKKKKQKQLFHPSQLSLSF
jgi:hypothetical protein